MKNTLKIAISIFIILILISCRSFHSQTKNNTVHQDNYYTELWKQVDSLMKLKLPKSADDIVEVILANAEEEKNTVHWSKSIRYKVDNMSVLKDEGEKKAIGYTQEMIEKSWSPARSILQFMLAKQYQRYAVRRMYKINDNTQMGALSTDIDEWSIVNYSEVISDLYFDGLQDTFLKSTPINEYEALLYNHNYNKNYRKTLYDVLVHEAIDYFSDYQFHITKPSDEFYLNDKRLFYPANDFVNIKFESPDSTDAQFKALILIQDLMKFHVYRNEMNELLDIDIKRLRWLNKNSSISDKSDRYFKALKSLKSQYNDKFLLAQVDLNVVKYYSNLAKFCNRGGENCIDRWALVKAKKILNEILKNVVEHDEKWEGITNMCKNMIQEIESSGIQVKLDKVQIPEENILATIDYKNLSEVNFKICKIPSDEFLTMTNSYDMQISLAGIVNEHKTIRKWDAKLPDPKDYLHHQVDVKIDPLSIGTYVLSWKDKMNNYWQHVIFNVTNLASFEHDLGKNGKYIVVLDRKHGKPLKNVDVVTYRLNRGGKAALHRIGATKTNDKGIAHPKLENNGYASIKLMKGEDIYYESNPMYRSNKTNSTLYYRTFLFLDRRIYRPGQLVNFKGMAIQIDKDRIPSLMKNQKIVVALRDVNNKIVREVELITNDFGSFSGQFVAPQDRLLGRMTITSSRGSRTSFKVEEYKRPKFYIEFDDIEEEYAVGDTLVLNGQAINYSGASLDGAKVKYAVIRRMEIPRWCGWSYGHYPFYSIPEKIIDRGQINTNIDGSFKISVNLEKAINSASYFWFNYEIKLSVIDINGEKIDYSKSIFAREQGLFLKANLTTSETKKNLEQIRISAFNMNGKELVSNISYEIMSLKHPSNGDLQRLSQNVCDTFIYSKRDYYRYFPNGVYGEDENPLTWRIESKVENGNVSSGQMLDLSELNSGAIYRLKLSSFDHHGEEIIQKYHFEINDQNGQYSPKLIEYWLSMDKSEYVVGEMAKAGIIFKSNPKHIYKYIARQSNHEGEWETNKRKSEEVKISKEDKGSLFMHWVAMKNNHLYQFKTPTLIGWEDKNLDIKLLTFRDKLRPGEEETWKIRIKDSKNELINAELLASMYDQSLDHFANNKWDKQKVWPSNQLMSRIAFTGSALVGSPNQYWMHQNLNNYVLEALKRYPSIKIYEFPGIWQYNGRSEVVMMDKDNPGDLRNRATAKSISNVRLNKGSDKNTLEHESRDPSTFTKIRSDLAETVFFYPHIKTNKKGEVTLSFTMKEALTKWRLQLFAHTKDLKMGLMSRSLVTQKELMVVPSTPRILRVDDEIWVTAKVINMTDSIQKGKVEFQWFDPSTEQDISSKIMDNPQAQSFDIAGKKSAVFKWKIKPTDDLGSLIKYRVVATGEKHSDGEENMLPILQNKILLTSSMLMQVPKESTKTFSFDLFINAKEHQKHHKLTLQYLSHPVWLAIQALPYLNNPSNKGTDMIVDQLFANAVSSHIAHQNPKIKAVFDQWNMLDSDALVSQLEKNEALKSVLLKETPWVLEGENESGQKKKIAMLFDMNIMSENLNRGVYKLKERQREDGGFGWFPGANQSSWYTTINVIENLSLLKSLNVDLRSSDLNSMIKKAIAYLDKEMKKQYAHTFDYVNRSSGKTENIHINSAMIKYLYIRSFHTDQPIPQDLIKEHDYYIGQMTKFWGDFSFYLQAMAGSTFHQLGMNGDRDKIVASLKEHAHYKESLGRYWRTNGYQWYQSEVETHTKIMALMRSVNVNRDYLDEMRLWLLKNKSANHWKSSGATVKAIYEILQNNNIIIEDRVNVKIKVGNEMLTSKNISAEESGTGFVQKSWSSKELTKDHGIITIDNSSHSTNWGAMYWQYFTPLDQVEADNKLPVKIKKELYKLVKTSTGDQLEAIEETSLRPGDELIVRLTIIVDRELNYIHLKDMRASGTEPKDYLSGYRWEGGASFYKTITDEAAHYYFEHLRPGTFVFENRLFVVHSGDFTTGPAIFESLYAPEYRAHTSGGRIQVAP